MADIYVGWWSRPDYEEVDGAQGLNKIAIF